MGQISNIAHGWAKYLTGTVTEKEKQRASICSTCDHTKEGTYEEWLPEKGIQEVKGMKCGECGCPLSTAIRSKDKNCPLGKW